MGPHVSKNRWYATIPATNSVCSLTTTSGWNPTAKLANNAQPASSEAPRPPRIKSYKTDLDSLSVGDNRRSPSERSIPGLGTTYEKAGLIGLRNIGNTCFMNAVIQCLSNTRPLLEYVMEEDYERDINRLNSAMKGTLMRSYAELIHKIWLRPNPQQHQRFTAADTTSFKDQIQRFAPRFIGYSQQDAQEFLRYLLQGLHEDINKVSAKPTPILTDIEASLSDNEKAAESWRRYLRYENSNVQDMFVGQLKSTLTCSICGHCSVTFDPFWDLSLPIPLPSSRNASVRLSHCFDMFSKEEVLEEKPTCEKCKCKRICSKKLSIQKFPRILVVHLKRFSLEGRNRGKLNTLVEYPLYGLDLSSLAATRTIQDANLLYNLYGVAIHSGSICSGHYIAYCKHPYTGEWHCFNDSRVSSMNPASAISSDGYVLFYEQVAAAAGQSSTKKPTIK